MDTQESFSKRPAFQSPFCLSLALTRPHCCWNLIAMASEGRIVLNIGGSRFEVPVTTLARHPESLLGSLVTGGESSEFKMEANGEYFFDRYVCHGKYSTIVATGPQTRSFV